MRNQSFVIYSLLFLSIFLGACQKTVFGVDEMVWGTLNEQEREKVIEGYNKRKEIELLNNQKEREKELENERHRQEIEAQMAPIYAATNAVSLLWGGKKNDPHYSSSVRIQSISHHGREKRLTIGNEQFEVSSFSAMSHAWVTGQRVELTKSEQDFFYPVKIRNLDNGESVNAKKHIR